MVEDAAHVLIPDMDIGSYGEFTFYSPHKLLAIPDGSVLIQRSKTKVLRELSDNNPEKVMRQILAKWNRSHHLLSFGYSNEFYRSFYLIFLWIKGLKKNIILIKLMSLTYLHLFKAN